MGKKTTSHADYEELKRFSHRIRSLESVATLLQWDQETYMPPGGNAPRSDQIAILSELIHEERTGKGFRNRLEKLVGISSGVIKAKGLSKEQRVAVREWHEEYSRSAKLPAAFVKELAQTTAEASQVWAMARKENRFELFAPFLERIVALNRKKADLLGFGDHPYDALLESYEPCATTAKLNRLFAGLKKELQGLLVKIEEKQKRLPVLKGTFAAQKQRELGEELLHLLPVDLKHIRLDLGTHPCSSSLSPLDCRITTRISERDPLSNLFSVLHETGHAMYDMGLPFAHFGTPLAEYVSLSIHESQSRWWETLIGRSRGFWKFFYPKLQKSFPAQLKKIPLERFYQMIHRVSRTLIRVEADEVTYNLHVVVRFELEKRLISGELKVAELPQAWNEAMRDIVGITPPTDREGCLQDIHWSFGGFGYFPTYTLGNLLAAHFFTAFVKKYPKWEARVAKGDFVFIREWLRKEIHCWGRTYDSEELAKRVTGRPLTEKAYCAYLKKKYLS